MVNVDGPQPKLPGQAFLMRGPAHTGDSAGSGSKRVRQQKRFYGRYSILILLIAKSRSESCERYERDRRVAWNEHAGKTDPAVSRCYTLGTGSVVGLLTAVGLTPLAIFSNSSADNSGDSPIQEMPSGISASGLTFSSL
jgi:hypothetical protein